MIMTKRSYAFLCSVAKMKSEQCLTAQSQGLREKASSGSNVEHTLPAIANSKTAQLLRNPLRDERQAERFGGVSIRPLRDCRRDLGRLLSPPPPFYSHVSLTHVRQRG